MVITEEILKNRTDFFIWDTSSVDHRSHVIMGSIDIEECLAERILEWFASVNPDFDAGKAREELIVNGPLNSPKKLADIAFFAGIIGPKTRHDVKKVVTLRDRYAHGMHDQLNRAPDLMKLVTDTFLYKENRAALQALPDQHEQRATFAVMAQLVEMIRSGALE